MSDQFEKALEALLYSKKDLSVDDVIAAIVLERNRLLSELFTKDAELASVRAENEALKEENARLSVSIKKAIAQLDFEHIYSAQDTLVESITNVRKPEEGK